MDDLPSWSTAAAVVAHPDDEAFGLGGVLAALVAAGTRVGAVVLTRGEASTLGDGDLASVRAAELAEAARRLGLEGVTSFDHPDGHLADVDPELLADQVTAAVVGADGLVAFDPEGITGHPDHVAATRAAVAAGRRLGIPVLGWVLPARVADRLNAVHGTAFTGVDRPELRIAADRERQREAIAAHQSQLSQVVWDRLELSGGEDWARWLTPPRQAR